MSDDNPAVSNTPADSEAPAPVRPRRSVPARAKKATKKATSAEQAAEPEGKSAPPAVGQTSAPPANEEPAPVIQPATVGEGPENASAAAAGESNKRKRRRRKGKGSQQPAANTGTEEVHPLVTDQAPPESLPGQSVRASKDESQRASQASGQPPSQPPQRRKFDADTVAKKAWKIYLAEVSEEGVALIGDNDARELSRRCFRLAEIFLDEQARRLSGQ